MNLVVGVPPIIVEQVQSGLLERAFHDGLFPNLLYRGEAQEEEWPANTGTEIFMSRAGLLPPVVRPLPPGQDPVPQNNAFEQWVARLARFGGTRDIHMPTSAVANGDLFLRDIHQMGLQAGQSLDLIARNALFQSYLSGHTVLIAATAAIDTQIRVAAINGFTDVIIPGTNVRPAGVSVSRPLAITIFNGATPILRNVIAAVPDDPDDPNGPGTLTLSVAVGAIVAVRSSVLSSARPDIIRSGGGTSIDAIGAGDVFSLQDGINAVSRLRAMNVMPHEDGFYHGHISNAGNSQVFTDPAWQRLNTALPDHVYYQQAFIGQIAGIAFMLNNQTPDDLNSGALTNTGTFARYSRDIGAETVNDAGVRIGRVIITGRGGLYERWLNEDQYVSEAGVTGKIGQFQVVNAGMQVSTDRIRLIMQSPTNRFQDIVPVTWSSTTSFPVPSDVTSGGPQRYKRALVIEHALE